MAIPVLTGVSTTVTFDENTVNATPAVIDSDVTLVDADENFQNGTLVVSGLLPEDRVSIQNVGTAPGEVSFAGGVVSVGGVAIGTATGGAGSPLTVTFNASATAATIEAVIENLTYQNLSNSPTGSRTLNITVTDSAGDQMSTVGSGYTQPTNPFAAIDVGSFSSPVFADLDGDGDLDLISGRSGEGLYVYTNTGGVYSNTPNTTLLGTADNFGDFVFATFADIDNDGDLDALAGEDGTNDEVVLLRNMGDATTPSFVNEGAVATTGDDGEAPVVADLDGDGDLDLIVGQQSGAISYFRNDGTASSPVFVQQTGVNNPFAAISTSDYSAPALSDMDGDGDLDLLVGGNSSVRFFENTGSANAAQFTERTGANNPFDGVTVGSAPTPTFADINGDGVPDVVVGNSSGTFRYFERAAVTGVDTTVNVTPQAEAPPTSGADTLTGGYGKDALSGGVNLIVNGSFETQDGVNDSRQYIYAAPNNDGFGIYWRSTSTLSGWQRTGGIDFELNTNFNSPLYEASDGNVTLDLENATGENYDIFQVVAGVTPSATYELSFDVAEKPGEWSNAVEIYWNNIKLGEVDPQSAYMSRITFSVTAEIGTNWVEFRGIGGADARGVTLDNVRLVLADSGADTVDYSAELGGGDVVVNLSDGVSGTAVVGLDVVQAGRALDSYGTLDTLTSIENVTTGAGDDTVIGSAVANVIATGDGDDTVRGGDGADIITSAAGADVLAGEGGDDTLTGGAGSDTLIGGANLIVNGSFETQNGINVSREFINEAPGTFNGLHYRENLTVAGWVFSQNEGTLQTDDTAGYQPSDGAVALDMEEGNGQPVFVYQDIAGLIDGEIYRLQFDTFQFQSFTATLEVYWNGVLVDTIPVSGSTPATNTYNLTAVAVGSGVGGANRLEFREVGSGSDAVGTQLDNVRLYAVSSLGDTTGADTVDYSAEGGSSGVTVDLATQSATDTFGNSDTLLGIDNVIGTALTDDISGDDGDNTLTGGGGDDTLDGGDGSDTAVYSGNRADYTVAHGVGSEIILTDTRASSDGEDTVDNVELFQFADGAVTAANLFNPALSGVAASVTYGENAVNAAAQIIDSDVSLDVPESLDNGTLTVTGLLAEDIVSIQDVGTGAGEIGFSGGDVSYGGTVIGTATGGNGATLTVTFNANATAEAVEALIEHLTYRNNSDNPTAARNLTITVTDGIAQVTSSIVAVNVTAENDAPEITSNGGGATANINVNENSTAVTTVVASDPDAGTTITYSIVGGADQALFDIDPSTGALVFLSAPNFEDATDAGANNTYEVTVRASDDDGTPLTDDQTITVTVQNVDEAPVISSNGGGATANVSIAENGTAVTTVEASDEDAASSVTYSITGGADGTLFDIDSSTGVLTFLSVPNFEAPADADTNNTYEVQVTATSGSLTDVQTISVAVTNVNEAPEITSNGGGATANVNVNENSTAVTTVTATDADAGTTITYSIVSGGDGALFTINSTGELAFVSAPNFENPLDLNADNTYEVTVRASDDDGTPLTDDQTITVTVQNVDEAPVISSNGGGATANVSISENATAVTTVEASDEDAASSVTYSITGGADSALFDIDSSTGVLTFVSAPNFEVPADADTDNTYVVQVTATSGSLTDTQTISVAVTDVNDAPEITSNGGGATANVNVNENTTAVTTVVATDADAGTTITYSIVGGADQALFDIDPATGALIFLSAPNFEDATDVGANNTYEVTVRASDDAGTPLADDQTITVTVQNVDEAPVISSNGGGATANVSIAENGTAVTTVEASDEDAASSVTYSITGGADGALFDIDSSTGVLTFVSAPNFEVPTDADTDNTYEVQVTATSGSLTDVQTISVTVNNVNEAPQITSNGGGSTANVNVNENSTAVTTVVASDADAGTTITYSVVGGADQALFDIDPSTGALVFLSAPNFEDATDVGADNTYEVTVRASDDDGTPLTDDQTITVSVQNVDEAPVISSNGGGTTANVSISENTTAVTTVVASDEDAASTVTYSITGGADGALFNIDPNTGVLTFVSAPNFEVPADADANNTYVVQVTATSGTLTDVQTIAVSVTNVNEAPQITSNGGGPTASVSVNENTTAVTTVTANDVDAGTTITYSIAGGTDQSRFTINPTTGVLAFVSAPNFEAPNDTGTNNTYEVTVRASDDAGTPLTDDQTITVTVQNVDEAPVISSNGGGATASVSISENTTAVTTVVAADPDAGAPAMAYSISGGADNARFSIDPNTGVLVFTSAPNFEAPTDADANNTYVVQVTATSGTLTDVQTITVAVTNQNEAPQITSNGGGSTATVSVAENSTAVTTVVASDADAGSTITYAIVGGADQSRFVINAATGALSFVSTPNFELPSDSDANNSYVVQVRASDGSLTDDQTITVNVTDVAAEQSKNDFNGDGKGDVLWQNTNGAPAVWLLDGTGVMSAGPVLDNPGPSWREKASGDFDGDGKADILWQNDNGTAAVWLMDGTTVEQFGALLPNPGPTWKAKEAADFNGDGKADILWQNDNGAASVWLMDGTSAEQFGAPLPNPGSSWQTRAAADFNGDGKADILWQNSDGTAGVWLMDGVDVLQMGGVLPNPGATWRAAAAGDFDGDGNADILWQNNDGRAAVWLMDGIDVVAMGAPLENPGATWRVKDAIDANGDGKADILWQNDNGTPGVWLMNGTSVLQAGGPLTNPGADWHIV